MAELPIITTSLLTIARRGLLWTLPKIVLASHMTGPLETTS